jgi:hypothetical protein
LASGLLAGSLLPPVPAALVTGLLVGVGVIATAVLVPLDASSPLGGFVLLARLDEVVRPVADGLRSSGVSLATAAGLLLITAAAIDRADL